MKPDQFQLRVPDHTVTFFGKGAEVTGAVEGDFLVVRHPTIFADVIARLQALENEIHHDLDGFTGWDHAAFTRGFDEQHRLMVSEMGPKNYERRPLFDYTDKECSLIHYNVSDELRAIGLANDVACSGIDYGWSDYIGDVIDGLDGGKLSLTFGDAVDCSCHTTLLAMGMGLFPDRLPSIVTPARFAKWHGAIFLG